MNKNPTAFISYSWENKENEEHKEWVKSLASRLRHDGVDVKLDQWEVVPGDQLPKYMESSIRENDYVLIICTPTYKRKSDNREGGVGYEGDIIFSEILQKNNHRKFIPILRKENWVESSPSGISGKYYIDLSTIAKTENNYKDLISTILNIRETPPAIGQYEKTQQIERKDDNSPINNNTNEITDKIIQVLRDRAYDVFKHQDSSWFHSETFDFLKALTHNQRYAILKFVIVEYLKEYDYGNFGFIHYLLEKSINLFYLPKLYQKYLESFYFEKLPDEALFELLMEDKLDMNRIIRFIERKQLITNKNILLRLIGFKYLFLNTHFNNKQQFYYKQIRQSYIELLTKFISKCYNEFEIIDISKNEIITRGMLDFDFDYSDHIKDINKTELFLFNYYLDRREMLDKTDYDQTVFSLYRYCNKLIKHQYYESSRLLFIHILDFRYWREKSGTKFSKIPWSFHLKKYNEFIRSISNPFYKFLFSYHICVTLFRELAPDSLLKRYEKRLLSYYDLLSKENKITFNRDLVEFIIERVKGTL